MDLHLSGKRAIVAGGSKGIGLAIARGLAAEGVDIAILARTERTVVSVARDLVSEFGIRAIGVVTDTRDDDAVQAS
ncbi:SDR family NAD(P)-dependent oxidoreductase, partial [Rhodococcus sp. EPR-134]